MVQRSGAVGPYSAQQGASIPCTALSTGAGQEAVVRGGVGCSDEISEVSCGALLASLGSAAQCALMMADRLWLYQSAVMAKC